jgi:hypothetical protein
VIELRPCHVLATATTANMKRATIAFSYVLDIAYDDSLDDEWVCEQFLRSDRFSTLHFEGEPGIVEACSYGVAELRRCDVRQP